jgi:hypothetical protein
MLIFRILKLSSTANYSKHMTLIRHQCQCWVYPDLAWVESVAYDRTVAEENALIPNTPGLLPLTSLVDLYRWYRLNLCQPEIFDCRGYRVRFQDTDFVQLIKLTNKYGKEPKNRRMTALLQSGR